MKKLLHALRPSPSALCPPPSALCALLFALCAFAPLRETSAQTGVTIEIEGKFLVVKDTATNEVVFTKSAGLIDHAPPVDSTFYLSHAVTGKSLWKLTAGYTMNASETPYTRQTLWDWLQENTGFNSGGSSSSTTLSNDDFSEELQFNSNKILPLNLREVQDTDNYSFTLASSGNVAGTAIYYYIQADGSGTFTFSDDFIILNSSITDGGTLTNEITYLLGFLYDGSSVSVSVSETDAGTIDLVAPTFASAQTVSDSSISVTFNEDLDVTGTEPVGSSFTFNHGAGTLDVDTVTFSYGSNDAVLLLSIDGTISGDSTLTIDYTKPGSNILADASGNEVASFSDESVTNNEADPFTGPSDLSPEYYDAVLRQFDGTTATDINIGVIDAFNTDDFEVYVWVSPDDGQPASIEAIYGFIESDTKKRAYLRFNTDGVLAFGNRARQYTTDAAVFSNGGAQPKYINVRVVSGVTSLYVDGSLVASTESTDDTPAATSSQASFYGSLWLHSAGAAPAWFLNGDARHIWIKEGALSGLDRTNMETFYGDL